MDDCAAMAERTLLIASRSPVAGAWDKSPATEGHSEADSAVLEAVKEARGIATGHFVK